VEEGKRGFLVHLAIYVLVNVMLIAINFIYSPKTIWFFYPLIGGLLASVAGAVAIWAYARRSAPS